MDPRPEQVAAFAEDARRRREELGLTTEEVATRVSTILGRNVTRQSVTQWENGQVAPRQADKLSAFDKALEAHGQLVGRLRPPDVEARLRSLEDRFERIERQLEELLRRRGR